MTRGLTTRWRTVLIATNGGQQPTSPTFTSLSFGGPVTLDSITFRIPPGHCGTTGLQVFLAGSVIFPYNAPSEWLVGNDYTIPVEFGVLVDSGLRIATYNLDVRTHRHFLDVKVSDIDISSVATVNAAAIVSGL